MTLDPSSLSERVTTVLRDALAVEVPSADTDLFDTGLLDSLGIVTLIAEVEALLGVALPLDDFDIDSFRTVERIAAFLAAELEGRSVA
jgi:D-alanine--poly(phosphoribitol) ligase subunit 2